VDVCTSAFAWPAAVLACVGFKFCSPLSLNSEAFRSGDTPACRRGKLTTHFSLNSEEADMYPFLRATIFAQHARLPENDVLVFEMVVVCASQGPLKRPL
jgi:hypothetical protein